MKCDASFLFAITVLCSLRLIAGAVLPLSSDEAYYWLWSRHLAAGYYDHPPAIALIIRAGTTLFGDTSFGVRAGGILLSFVASWFVWRTGAILGRDEKVGAKACLFFNLTLMLTVESLAATPDAASIVAAAAFCWSLAKIAETGDGRWWLAAGLAAGLGLLSKYTALFLGLGTLVWLVACLPMRRSLLTPWPYASGFLAFVLFVPNLWWNAAHGWATFLFQFGRIGGEHYTLRFLFEFLGAQAVLATPFILVLGVMGLVTSSWHDERKALVPAILWTSIAYFTWHSLHDRVQGNWPCFLYPLLSVAAALAVECTDWSSWRRPLARWSARLAIPVAAILLLCGYAQALIGVVPLGRKDPLARLLAVGLPDVVSRVETLREDAHADALITTEYASTAWFAFYSRAHPPIVQIGEEFRWPDAPAPQAKLFSRPALYVTEIRHDRRDLLAVHFSSVREIARIDRKRDGIPIAHYIVYRIDGLKGGPIGRMP